MTTVRIIEFSQTREILPFLSILQFMYPNLQAEELEKSLEEMLPLGYKFVVAFNNDNAIAVAGYWLITRLWCGKTLDVDNVVVHPDYRSQNVGQVLFDWFEQKAKAENCKRMVLDVFVGNHKAHKFYFNQGFAAHGFHFTKEI